MKKLIPLLIIGILIMFVIKTAYNAGSFKTIHNEFNGKTVSIDNIWGGEDITIDQSTGQAFVSSTDRWSNALHHTPKRGNIFLINLQDSLMKPINLTQNFSNNEFRPHGISLWKAPNGKRFLFAISHQNQADVVEKFEFQDSVLIHVETFKNPDFFVSPNDIVAVGERQFYFTNDHDQKPNLMRTIKDYLQIGTGYVVYYDGKSYHKTSAKDIQYANGININNKQLFVAASGGNKIHVFNIVAKDGQLVESDIMDIGTGGDNIEIDTAGNLWVGCHPKLLKFVSHSKDGNAISPSEVIKISYKGKGKYTQSTIYMNDGSQISASSVGAAWKNKLVIGPVFQDHIIIADIK